MRALNILVLNILVLIAGIAACGLISIYFGKELNWDLANYHYYNAFSFLHRRWNTDYWPTSFVHVHFTPTLDFLTYFLINYFPPRTTTFLIGAIHGINFWLIFSIGRLSLPDTKYQNIIGILLAMLGLYGPTVLPGIGSFQHDDLVSLFVLGFVFLQLKIFTHYTKTGTLSFRMLFISSVLLGIGAGCKLTAGVFVGGSLLAFMFMPISVKQRTRVIMTFFLGVGIGVFCSSGYWMLFLWQKYHNPFFPLLNGIFHSPDFPGYNWRDSHFLPHGFMQTLFYPFYFSWDGRTGDTPFRDFRYAILYFMLAVYAFSKKRDQPLNLPIKWFFLFFIFSYILWQFYFSIMRYIVALEMLTPLIIYLVLYQLVRDVSVRFTSAVFLFFFIASTMVPTHMVRAGWYETDYFNVKLPAFVKTVPEAMVLVPFPAFAFDSKPRPQSYLIPFFPNKWHFAGIPFLQNKYAVPRTVYSLVKNYQGKNIFLLSSPEYMPIMFQIANLMGLKPHASCSLITSDRQVVTHEEVLLCPVRK